MALLADTLEAVDAEGMPAYLESTNPANDARYMRVGFRPVGSVELENGHRITTMWRDSGLIRARVGADPLPPACCSHRRSSIY